MRKSQPALKHPEHRARSRALVVIAHNRNSRAGFPRIILFLAALSDLFVHAAETIAILFPALDAPAFDVRSECELAVAWFPNVGAVGVGLRLGGRDQGVLVGRVPDVHEGGLGGENIGKLKPRCYSISSSLQSRKAISITAVESQRNEAWPHGFKGVATK
jgi:hypothetical protein